MNGERLQQQKEFLIEGCKFKSLRGIVFHAIENFAKIYAWNIGRSVENWDFSVINVCCLVTETGQVKEEWINTEMSAKMGFRRRVNDVLRLLRKQNWMERESERSSNRMTPKWMAKIKKEQD